ncbi:MAG: DUF2892 domain-containing protein [Candidatus Diapherotrites archaeon]
MDLKKLLLEENVGGMDLFLRAIIGTISVFALALGIVPSGTMALAVALVGAIGLFSSLTRHCTPYALIGFSTAKKPFR